MITLVEVDGMYVSQRELNETKVLIFNKVDSDYSSQQAQLNELAIRTTTLEDSVTSLESESIDISTRVGLVEDDVKTVDSRVNVVDTKIEDLREFIESGEACLLPENLDKIVSPAQLHEAEERLAGKIEDSYKDHQTQIDNLSSTTTIIKNDLSTTNMSLVEVRELVKAAGQELDELREHVEASDEALVEDVVKTINEICVTKEYLAGVEEKIQEQLDSTHTTCQSQFNEISEQTTSLKNDIKSAKEELGDVNSRLDGVIVANLLLKDDIRDVKQDIELTNSRIDGVISSNKLLEDKIETVDARVDELAIANISLRGDIGDVRQEVEKTNSRIDGVDAVTSAMQNDICNVKEEVRNVNSRVDDIDSKISCMKEYVTLLAQIYSQMSKHL